MHIKGKVAKQIQPYVKDYLQNIEEKERKLDTKKVFRSQDSFIEEIERIFREVDKENQAKRVIIRLK